MTLVDTNVVLDVLARDSIWLDWAAEQLSNCRERGALFINEIVYAEIAVRIETEPALQQALSNVGIQLERMPTSALHLAGQAFKRYRLAGGPRTSLIPDFFIGAHAQILDCPILTRDVQRYRTYFPEVQLVTPASRP